MKKNKVFASWPHYGTDEISAVARILRFGKVNQWTGREVFSFEKEYADFLGIKYAVALANGSVALDMALMALGIGAGDEVIVPSRSFVASASCVALRKAVPVFADVDMESQNITVSTIEKVFTRRTKAIIAVHLAGWPCELDLLRDFCDKKGIYLIEDCAQAHGAMYNGKPVGSYGDIACFSFCQDKIISTGGEGGLLATNDEKIWQKVWSFKDHGRDHKTMFSKKDSRGFVWAVYSFGSNYRMTEMQAAIGRIQLRKLPQWSTLRRRNAAVLTVGFSCIPGLRLTIPPKEVKHAYYKYYAFVEPRSLKSGWSRDRVIVRLIAEGIPCGSGSCSEIYMEKAFDQGASRPRKRLPLARRLGETSLMFTVHPTLSTGDMKDIVRAVDKVMKIATRHKNRIN